ncbi:MAG: SDR family oxidoreductase [Promethearchaeota archaeon]
MTEPNDNMLGKICMITGANSGIGKVTALELAKKGAKVVMVCRDKERGEAALTEIKEQSGNENIDLMIADLGSLESVRQLISEFKARYNQLHVLVNNAGLLIYKYKETADGIESTFAINHLGHFLLTNSLLDRLKASVPARIINVSSGAHEMARSINFNDLQGENGKKYSRFGAYARSKLANVLFTYELARRLEGTGVTVNSLHPGGIRTNFGKTDAPWIFRWGMSVVGRFLKSPEKGAQTSIYLASSSEVEGVSGKYFVNCKEKKSSKVSYNESLQKELWDVSEKLTKLN